MLKSISNLGTVLNKEQLKFIQGGGWIRVYVTCGNNCSAQYAGLSSGLYLENTETGQINNILGSCVRCCPTDL